MRDAETILRMIELYRIEADRLEALVAGGATIGFVLSLVSCKVSISELYEELESLRVGNVERIRPNVDRRRRSRKQAA